MPVIVVEDDKILRALQVVLDPSVSPERVEAFRDYLKPDVDDMDGWVEKVRADSPGLYPATIRMVPDETAMRAALGAADALVVEGLKVGADDLARGPALKLVHKFGVDARNIDLQACAARGVPVKTVRRRVNGGVAEHVFALAFALTRKICLTDGRLDFASLEELGFRPKMFDQRHVSGANWARVTGMRPLEGQTIGLIGMGEIGREVAPRARAFGMEVLYYQRTALPAAVTDPLGARFAPLDELLAQSDILAILVPLTPETEGMIGREAFARMKPGAVLINVSRAPIVDRDALIEALDSGRLGGAGLDVHYAEPGDPDEPLKRYPNVVLTPHIAPATRHTVLADFAEVVSNLAAALR